MEASIKVFLLSSDETMQLLQLKLMNSLEILHVYHSKIV
jgi:hypothetical protein